MKLLLPIVFIFSVSACNAETSAKNSCQFSKNNINLTTPKSPEIINTHWQESNEGNETVNRLYLSYVDGSMAVIEHKYCSMYNYEVAYYSANKNSASTIESMANRLTELLSYAALKAELSEPPQNTIKEKLKDKGFEKDSEISFGFHSSDSKNQLVEYSFSYAPNEQSSIHRNSTFIYMGIGGNP